MSRLRQSPERDRAWGRYYRQHGVACVTREYFTSHTNEMRIALYQMKRADMLNNSRFSGVAY